MKGAGRGGYYPQSSEEYDRSAPQTLSFLAATDVARFPSVAQFNRNLKSQNDLSEKAALDRSAGCRSVSEHSE